ncbi:MAG: DMT family transporter [Pseudomonadales bacterium]
MNSTQQTSSHFQLGLLFATTAVVFWGVLPIALKLSSAFIDPVSLTWFRFFTAFVISVVIQYLGGRLLQFKQLERLDWIKLTLAALCSVSNYVTFVYCLEYLAPGPAQLNFQTAPFFLAFGGALFFKERLSALQMSCFATLALGMLMFFNPYLSASDQPWQRVLIGVALVQFSALSWVCYALLQKSLIAKLSPANILLYIYGAGLFMMLPFVEFTHFAVMSGEQWVIALFCAFNTLIAYGSFAQSMKYWPTAQVGATVALTPIFSFLSSAVIVELGWWQGIIESPPITTLAYLGIALVILSVLCVQLQPLWNRRNKAKKSGALDG